MTRRFHPGDELAYALWAFAPTHPKAKQPSKHMAGEVARARDATGDTRRLVARQYPQIVWAVHHLRNGNPGDVLDAIGRAETRAGRGVNDE